MLTFLVGIIAACAVTITLVCVTTAFEMRRTARQVDELLDRTNRATREAEQIIARGSAVLAGALDSLFSFGKKTHSLLSDRFLGNGARHNGSRRAHGVRNK